MTFRLSRGEIGGVKISILRPTAPGLPGVLSIRRTVRGFCVSDASKAMPQKVWLKKEGGYPTKGMGLDLRIVWLKLHFTLPSNPNPRIVLLKCIPCLLKLTIRWILRKGLLITQIGFQGSNLIRNSPPEACLEHHRLLRNRIGTDLQWPSNSVA
jgi:hypothetical protein